MLRLDQAAMRTAWSLPPPDPPPGGVPSVATKSPVLVPSGAFCPVELVGPPPVLVPSGAFCPVEFVGPPPVLVPSGAFCPIEFAGSPVLTTPRMACPLPACPPPFVGGCSADVAP